jgi:hypothetical protein
MNSNELQNIWNSSLNNLSSHQQEQLAGQFIRQMNRRRGFQSIWLINTFAWLTIISVMALWSILVGNTKLTHEWALLPLLIVPWAFAVYFLRSYLKSGKPVSQGELSVVESLRAALASNLNRQLRLKIVGGLYVILIPVLALAMRQLHAVGKVSEREFVSMAVLFGGALLVSALAMTALFFGRLLPQQRRLEGLLAEAAN